VRPSPGQPACVSFHDSSYPRRTGLQCLPSWMEGQRWFAESNQCQIPPRCCCLLPPHLAGPFVAGLAVPSPFRGLVRSFTSVFEVHVSHHMPSLCLHLHSVGWRLPAYPQLQPGPPRAFRSPALPLSLAAWAVGHSRVTPSALVGQRLLSVGVP